MRTTGSAIKLLGIISANLAAFGFVALVVAQGAPGSVALEAESGTVSGTAAKVTDNTASGNSHVGFSQQTQPPATGRCQHTATKVCYNGRLWHISGANMPWRQWAWAKGEGDFGGGNRSGVIANRSSISNKLAQFSASGSRVVRWWMFEGGAWQINRDGSGRPTTLNTAIYADIDAALELAEQHDVYYNFTLFAGMTDIPRSWRENVTHRQALADALAPLFARYKDNPRVMVWEIWNEPEWQYWNNLEGSTQEQATDMASRIIAVIRRESPKTLTTVGQARIDGIGDWKNVDLDFDSPHWYDPMTGSWDCAICTTAQALQQQHGTNGRPIVIGEFYASPGTTSQNQARWNDLRNRGYAGMWGWSLFNDQTGDNMHVDLTALTNFSNQHSDIGPKN